MTERVAGVPILHPLMSSPGHYRAVLRPGKRGWLLATIANGLEGSLGSPDVFVDRLAPASVT